MTKKKKKTRCKTCNSPHRAFIERAYLIEGKSGAEISKILKKEYGFSITAAALLNHFRKCLKKDERLEKLEEESRDVREEVIKGNIKATEMVLNVLASLYQINTMLHNIVINRKGENIGRTTSDLIRNYTGEMREYIKLYKELIENAGGTRISEKDFLAEYEKYRQESIKLLDSLESYEEKEDEGEVRDEAV